MLGMSNPLDESGSSSKQRVTQLRKLLADPKGDPETATKEWIEQAAQAELRYNRMELKLLLGMLERIPFPMPSRLEAHYIYYQGFLHELDTEFPKAIEFYRQGLEFLKTTPNLELLHAMLERGLGISLARLGESQEAMKFLPAALEVARQHKHKPTEAGLLSCIAFCHYKLGELRKGAEIAQQAITLHQETGNVLGEASATNTMGICYTASDHLEEGRQALERSASLRRAHGNTRDLGTIYMNLGGIHEKLGDFKAAIESAQLAYNLSSQINNQPIMGITSINLALYYNHEGDTAKALESINRSIQIFQDMDDQTLLTCAFVIKAVSYGIAGKREQALKFLAQGESRLAQVKSKKNNTILAHLYKDLTEAVLHVAVSPEDYQKSFAYRDEALALLGQINDNYTSASMLEAETKILLNPQHKYKYRKVALQSLQKWWGFIQKLPATESLKHLDTMLILAELLGEEGFKEQGFEMYNLVFAQLKSGKTSLDRRKLAEHYAKAARLTTPDKSLPLLEQALELFKAETSDMVRIKELSNEINLLRKQTKGKWFSGKN